MKYEKLQVDLLKLMFKKSNNVIHGTIKDGRVAIGTPHFLMFVPAEKILIKFQNEPFKGLSERFDIDQISPHYEPAKKLYTFEKTIDDVKRQVAKFQTESGKIIYMNSDFLKYFEKNATVFIRNSVDFTCVFEGDMEFAGIIFPIRVREDDE